MAAEQQSEKYIEELREAFALFDKDNDGCITAKEVRTVMHGLRLESYDQEITDMINTVDIDGSGTVDFNEFLSMMARCNCRRVEDPQQHKTEEEELRHAFKVFDIDGNGYVDSNELKITMFNLGENLSDKDVKHMLKLADQNKDGKIDYEEFIYMMYHK